MTVNYSNINKVLNKIFPLPKNLGVITNDYYEDNEFLHFLTTEIYDVDPDAFINHGISKLVIISPNFGDAVIKIPFNGIYEEDSETGELQWYDFQWAAGSDPNDYCLTEYEKYHRLKNYGLDCFVAKILYYKKINGIRVFLQEQVTPENELCTSYIPSLQSKTLAEKWRDEGKISINSTWIANCLDKYGESKVKRFLYFCENIDLDILEDAHCGNYGYRKNGTPAILDYSNYQD